MIPSKIFLAGLPGTGKTEFAKYLSSHYGYVHFDLEKDDWPQPELRAVWNNSRSEFVSSIIGQNVVLNWGFPVNMANWVKEILENGFAFVWFTGDEECARNWYFKREQGLNMDCFEKQIQSIKESNCPDFIGSSVIKINVFKDDCQFKDYEEFLKMVEEQIQ